MWFFIFDILKPPRDLGGHLNFHSFYRKFKFKPKLSGFLLDLHQSLEHQGLAKSLDISIGMPTLFANLATSRS
jgi:hypothetical protein